MTFSDFINKTDGYLKSCRILEDYVSFDFYLPETWNIPNKMVKDFEVIPGDKSSSKRSISFVCKNEKKVIDNLEQSFDLIIRFNKEREEKERLFKAKIQELKGLFEKEDIDSLRTLKFDLDEYEKLVGYEYKQEERGTVDVVQDGDSEGRGESKQG